MAPFEPVYTANPVQNSVVHRRAFSRDFVNITLLTLWLKVRTGRKSRTTYGRGNKSYFKPTDVPDPLVDVPSLAHDARPNFYSARQQAQPVWARTEQTSALIENIADNT